MNIEQGSLNMIENIIKCKTSTKEVRWGSPKPPTSCQHCPTPGFRGNNPNLKCFPPSFHPSSSPSPAQPQPLPQKTLLSTYSFCHIEPRTKPQQQSKPKFLFTRLTQRDCFPSSFFACSSLPSPSQSQNPLLLLRTHANKTSSKLAQLEHAMHCLVMILQSITIVIIDISVALNGHGTIMVPISRSEKTVVAR